MQNAPMSLEPRLRRRDIEGVRALAILSVVIYHVDNTWLPGGFVGVDIFFVLSGFLITGIWIKDIESASWRMLPEFWGRRILRLLPAATLVLSVTALASAWVMPAADRGHIAEGIRAATFYMANIFYANDSLDYLATDVSASPVLHFWSLGVEEQFYVVWPTLFLLSLGFSKNTRRTRWILVVIAAVSFGLSIYQTKTVQPYAFFGAPARAWQLGVGALLALNYHHFGRVWPRVRGLLGTFGLVLIGIAFFKMAVIIESGWQYPGVPALLPTLGAALILVGGAHADADTRTGRFLSNTPFQWLGAVSYSWYLWHWPMLVLAKAKWPAITSGQLAWVAVASLLVAFVSLKFYENPIRFSPLLRRSHALTFLLGAAMMATSTISANYLTTRDASQLEAALPALKYSPSASKAVDDVPMAYAAGCMSSSTAQWIVKTSACVFGDPKGKKLAILFGDSHAAHWLAAADAAAKRQGYRLEVRIKTFCTPVTLPRWDEGRGKVYTECQEWKAKVIEDLRKSDPDVIFWAARSSGEISVVQDGHQVSTASAEPLWQKSLRDMMRILKGTTDHVVAIADTPFAPYSMPSCVSNDPEHPQLCDFPISKASLTRFDLPVLKAIQGITVFDFTNRFCTNGICHSVIDGVFVYRDQGHITNSFSATFADEFASVLPAAESSASPTPSP